MIIIIIIIIIKIIIIMIIKIIITMIIIIIVIMVIIVMIIIFIPRGLHSQIKYLIFAVALGFKDYTFHTSGHRVENCSSRYSFLNDERDGANFHIYKLINWNLSLFIAIKTGRYTHQKKTKDIQEVKRLQREQIEGKMESKAVEHEEKIQSTVDNLVQGFNQFSMCGPISYNDLEEKQKEYSVGSPLTNEGGII